MVFVVQRIVDGAVDPNAELMTGLVLEDPDHDAYAPLTTKLIRGWAMRFEPLAMTIPVGELVSDMGALGFEWIDANASRGRDTPARIRFLPLTVENFVVFKDIMVGWQDLNARLRTTPDLRFYFREQMIL